MFETCGVKHTKEHGCHCARPYCHVYMFVVCGKYLFNLSSIFNKGTHKHAHTYIRMCIYKHTHFIYIYIYMNAHANINTHTSTYEHTDICIYIVIHRQTFIVSQLFSVARHILQARIETRMIFRQSDIFPLSYRHFNVNEGIFRYTLIDYWSALFMRRTLHVLWRRWGIYIYLYLNRFGDPDSNPARGWFISLHANALGKGMNQSFLP